ncbi:MAG: hypothetical protein CVU86_07075 [Firmicutes bacterium HGW-Firmicutes-11]|jgi:hypothetical protein|nr:MAG: hypothetical protein CVU94_00730 [Firmicutes bacterium HGW-Firmicutes-19]PKM84487.1 MAG: hypothetical protein CVU86_07075 [Firmicutes bacterium HGW-Firmicutes-11]
MYITVEMNAYEYAKILGVTVGQPFKAVASDEFGECNLECVVLENGTVMTITNGNYSVLGPSGIRDLLVNEKGKPGQFGIAKR